MVLGEVGSVRGSDVNVFSKLNAFSNHLIISPALFSPPALLHVAGSRMHGLDHLGLHLTAESLPAYITSYSQASRITAIRQKVRL